MSFAPNQPSATRMPSWLRTLIYWILIVGLSIFLWEAVSKLPHSSSLQWVVPFAGVIGFFAAWIAIYFVWKKLARRGARDQGSPNRPIG